MAVLTIRNVEDAQIAAIAQAHHLELVTRHVSDFKGIEGLAVLNPWQPGI